jgi:hypothetical protein
MCNISSRHTHGLVIAAVAVSIWLALVPAISAQDAPQAKPQRHSTEEIVGWIVKNSDVKVGDDEQSIDNHISEKDNPCSLDFYQYRENHHTNWATFTTYHHFVQLSDLNPDNIQINDMQPINKMRAYRVFLYTTNGLDKIRELKKSQRIASGHIEDLPDKDFMDLALMFFVSDQQMAQRMAAAFKDAITQCGGKADVKDIY